jgi:hypothetical protein
MAWDKNRIREEKVARLVCAGMSDADIAIAVGLTPAGLAQLKTRQTYKDIILRVKEGVVSEMDEMLTMKTEELRDYIQDNVPVALQAIVDTIQQTKDKKLRLAAAETLLAIDGKFAKVSRTGVALPEQGGVGQKFNDDDAIVQTILAAKKKAQAQATIEDEPITETTQ